MSFICKAFLLLFFLINSANAADPSLKITAPVASLKIGTSTTVTFTFDEPVTGFDLTDIYIKGNGQFLTGITGSGAVYQVNFQKTIDNNNVSLVVDNNAATPVGHGASIGFNNAPKIYIKQGGVFNNKLIEAVPQPECPKVGEILVDANNLPATRAIEDYYIFVSTNRYRSGMSIRQIRQACLTRLINGQKFVKKVSPRTFETNNVHGGHNHSTLMPKVTQQYIQPIVGTTKTRVTPQNAVNCNVDGGGFYDCGDQGAWRAGNLPAKLDFDDPIVYPNIKGAAHAHVFYGNNAVNYQTNTASLIKNCSSSFAGGVANCTGYWMPSVVDTATDTAIMPESILVYYKALFNAHIGLIEPLPQGLKIIAGNPAAKNAAEQTDPISFSCFPRSGSGVPQLDSTTFINCSGDDYAFVRLEVSFPPCVADNGFGGMQLDSPNHRSHLIPHNLVAPRLPNGCTSGFPHRIPIISQIAGFPLQPGQNTATWRLSSDNYSAALPGAASAHADWWGGWKTYWINRIVDQCNNKIVDCGVNYVGLNDGVAISSITTVGNVATITTAVPHLLKTSLPNGAYPDNLGNGLFLMGRISGVTGADAAAYNFDVSKVTVTRPEAIAPTVVPVGSQPLTILNATQIQYTLNYTPANSSVVLTAAKLQWGEMFCEIYEPCGNNQTYSDFYYGGKQ